MPELPRAEQRSLREYALLADGERGILVGPRGDFEWMCFPRWDSDAVFASLIGGSGVYAVTPADTFVWGGYYEPGSLIWRSRWVTRSAVIECREALALPGHSGRAVILRRVIAQKGSARVRVVLNARGAFGRVPLRRLEQSEGGDWSGELGDLCLWWAGGARARAESDGHGGTTLRLELELSPGDHHDLVLVLTNGAAETQRPDPNHEWLGTEAAWRTRVPELSDFSPRRDARHAFAVLNGLTSASGGMVAAATMSLPERARQGRNHDYRYSWIRDQCYAGQAVAAIGPHPLLDDAVRFVCDRLLADGAALRPAYTTVGGPVPDERAIDLPGYPGGTDIAGNRVNQQFQLDAFGEALLLFAAAARHDRLNADSWSAADVAASAIADNWRRPDAGIWELEPDEWTHSRLTCVAGLRAISSLGPQTHAARWLTLADAITADTSARGIHPSGRWQRSPGDDRIDAALLLPAIRGAIPHRDARSVATLQAVIDDLTEDGYAYRYRPDARPLGEAEGAFLLCGFLMALAHGQQGDHVAAARWFERTRAACGPPGLLSEEYDTMQRQLRGNLPQAFVHALLLECAAQQHVREDR